MGEMGGTADECEEREELEGPDETSGPDEAAEESPGGPETLEADLSPEMDLFPETSLSETDAAEVSLREAAPGGPVIPETSSAATLSEAAGETGFREEESVHIVSQILAELPSPPLSAGEALARIENDYHLALDQILAENGKYMSSGDMARAGGSCFIGAAAPSGNELGVYRSDGRGGVPTIEIMTRDPELIHSTVQHEMNHRTAHEGHIVVPDQFGHSIYLTSGFYHSGYYHSSITGRDLEIPGCTARGRGLDEGFTEHLAIEQLTRQSAAIGEAAANERCYETATALAAQMEEILGADICRAAYYGGKTNELTAEFDDLAGREGAFREFESCLDRTLSVDEAERDEAAAHAMDILADLAERSGK